MSPGGHTFPSTAIELVTLVGAAYNDNRESADWPADSQREAGATHGLNRTHLVWLVPIAMCAYLGTSIWLLKTQPTTTAGGQPGRYPEHGHGIDRHVCLTARAALLAVLSLPMRGVRALRARQARTSVDLKIMTWRAHIAWLSPIN